MNSCCPLLILVLCTTTTVAQEAKPLNSKPIPKVADLERVVGAAADDDAFQQILKAYDFTENPKRERSWGSSFGVFFAVNKDNRVIVGIRPPSSATNMPTYAGELPQKLKPEISIAEIENKLGRPKLTSGELKGQYIMMYEGLHVITLNGQLFEIWLTSASKR
jgi:hypothetical protein